MLKNLHFFTLLYKMYIVNIFTIILRGVLLEKVFICANGINDNSYCRL